MTFADKSIYDRIFQQVTHGGGESEMNYTKIFQNAHALSISVGNSYLEDQLMHTFLDNYTTLFRSRSESPILIGLSDLDRKSVV